MKVKKQIYWLGAVTTHIRGRHYVTICHGNTLFLSFNYGTDYANAIQYVRELNKAVE